MKKIPDDVSVDELRLYSEATCATILGTSKKTITNLRNRGALRYVKMGRRIGVRRDELKRFIEAGTQGGWAIEAAV